MSDQSDSIPPKGTAPVDFRRLKQLLFGRVKIPGWILILFAIFNYVPDVKSRLDFWSDMARSAGGHMSELARYTSSGYFPASLALIGFLYIVFIGEGRHTQRHYLFPLLGWMVIASCLTLVSAVSISGAFEYAVRREIATRQSTILHDGTNPMSKPQDDPSFTYARSISPDQYRQFVAQCDKLLPYKSSLSVANPINDAETFGITRTFLEALNRGGLTPQSFYMNPQNASQTGIMIVVKDNNSIPEGAEQLRKSLEVIGIFAPIVTNTNASSLGTESFILFVGPRPV